MNELEFISTAKRLISVYHRKAAQLQAMVSEWESDDAKQGELPMRSMTITDNDAIAENGSRYAAFLANRKPRKASQWIRFAIEKEPNRITNSNVLSVIKSVGDAKAAAISSPRVSTAFYQLRKDGEIEEVERVPGGAATYRTTSKFQPWHMVKRADRKGKEAEARA